jgi:hypothetical protein
VSTAAANVAVVVPLIALNVNHEQLFPKMALNATPTLGFVLVTVIVCGEGAGAPT